jgi:hypothetical protein
MGVGRLIDLSSTGALVESALHLTPAQVLMVHFRRGKHYDVDLLVSVVRVHRKAAAAAYGLKFIRA